MTKLIAASLALSLLSGTAHARGSFHANEAAPPSLGQAVAHAVAHSLAGVSRAMASFYGAPGEHLNRHTADGSVFNSARMTAAHRTLPFGTMLQVTYAGKSVVVRVNDRGPAAWTGRALDLSYGAALKIGLVPHGSGPVLIAVLN